MTTILFLQTDWLEHLGPLYLSAFLKSQAISSSLLISRSPQKIAREIAAEKPEFLAMSLPSAGHRPALELLAKLKAVVKIPVVIGGPHPTFFPEALAHPAVDFILQGEAEESFYQLVLARRNNSGFERVAGLGYKQNGGLKYNPPAPLRENLDALPFPDRSLYLRYGFFRRLSMRRVIACRGCPFSCRYCFNTPLREFYAGRGKYVRQRSVDNILAELKELKPISRTINFVDDSFGLDRGMARELFARYGKEIGLPFIINLRPEQVDAELAKALAGAGCYCAQIGIESGNGHLREQVLGRKISDEQIKSAARLLSENGIKVLSYNMLGLPGETLDQGFETISLNRELKIDFPRFSIFQPYPGTELGEEIIKQGLADRKDLLKKFSPSYFHSSPLNLPETRKLENLQKLFWPAIKFPGLESAIKSLTKLPRNPLFDLVFLSAIAVQYRRATNLSFSETMEYGLKNLALYFG